VDIVAAIFASVCVRVLTEDKCARIVNSAER